jgi:hypothetical protein
MHVRMSLVCLQGPQAMPTKATGFMHGTLWFLSALMLLLQGY